MRIIGIGDIHGRSSWKDIVIKEKDADKIVFQADYFDSRQGHSGMRQLTNYNDIIEFKESRPDQVVLLFGNHDYHYLSAMKERYSGFQSSYAIDFEHAINIDLNKRNLQMAYMADGVLFTHAGVTKTWLKEKLELEVLDNNTVDIINDYLFYKPSVFKFNSGPNASQTGDDITQSPIWVRPFSLSEDKFDIWYSVGHTQVEDISIVDEYKIVLTDCLARTNAYVIFEDGIPSEGRV